MALLFQVEHFPTKEVCERNSESRLWVRDMYQVLFNKTSRQILARSHRINRFLTNYMNERFEWEGQWKWETAEVGVGLYLSFLQTNAAIRPNDNPPTNPRYLDAGFRAGLPDSGLGSDFSTFFKRNPVFNHAIFYYEDTKKIIKYVLRDLQPQHLSFSISKDSSSISGGCQATDARKPERG